MECWAWAGVPRGPGAGILSWTLALRGIFKQPCPSLLCCLLGTGIVPSLSWLSEPVTRGHEQDGRMGQLENLHFKFFPGCSCFNLEIMLPVSKANSQGSGSSAV
jgi:hypothetical protein